jgi:hypothetical protein
VNLQVAPTDSSLEKCLSHLEGVLAARAAFPISKQHSTYSAQLQHIKMPGVPSGQACDACRSQKKKVSGPALSGEHI